MVEAFIEEGFLSFDDLTFMEPAQMAELAGVTEDQGEDMSAYAEEAAERVEEETKAAKEAEAQERAMVAAAPPRPADTPRAALERLLGPDLEPRQEEKLSAAQLLGDAPPEPEP